MTGRDEEFDLFVRDRAGPLHRVAFLLCGDWHLADDLVQEALVKCFRHWRRVQRSETPDAYVRRILVNEANRYWKRNRHSIAGAGGPSGPEPATADRSAAVTDRAALLQALMALPAGQRAVVVLRHFEDMSEHDTAVLLGCSEGTVKSQNSRAMRALRANLPRQETTR